MSDFTFNFDDDFFGLGEKPKKEKPTKKADKKPSEKKTSAKKAKGNDKGKDFYVSLPVMVKGRNFQVAFSEEDFMEETIAVSKICEELTEKHCLEEMKIPGMAIFFIPETNTLYVDDTKIVATIDNSTVFEKETDVIKIINGGYISEISPSVFPDLDLDEINVKELCQVYWDLNHVMKGCKLYVNKALGLAYPVLEACKEKDTPTEDIPLYLNGTLMHLEGATEKTFEEHAEYLYKDVSSSVCRFYKTSAGNYFLSYERGKYECFLPGGTVVNEKATISEERYKLPMQLYLNQFYQWIELTPEMFGGKEKITKEDITACMQKNSHVGGMFLDTERKPQYLYNPSSNVMSCDFSSGKKGAISFAKRAAVMEEMFGEDHKESKKLIRCEEELTIARNSDFFIGECHEIGSLGSFRLEALPIGNFFGFYDNVDTKKVERVEFEYKLPKISKSVLNSIIAYFKKDLDYEACVRILYNKNRGEYIIAYADGKRTKSFIAYDFSSTSHLLASPDVLLVMQIHSHDTMPAFFSAVDNEDERGYTGIFGVIGNLDKENPSMLFRVGMGGENCFAEIDPGVLFKL